LLKLFDLKGWQLKMLLLQKRYFDFLFHQIFELSGKDFPDGSHHHICAATTKLFENLLPNLEFNSNEVELVTELNNWLPLIKLIAVAEERLGEIDQL
jgi:hypothetical protein